MSDRNHTHRPADGGPPDEAVERVLAIAEQHGREAGIEYECGDLRELVWAAWRSMAIGQRAVWLAEAEALAAGWVGGEEEAGRGDATSIPREAGGSSEAEVEAKRLRAEADAAIRRVEALRAKADDAEDQATSYRDEADEEEQSAESMLEQAEAIEELLRTEPGSRTQR